MFQHRFSAGMLILGALLVGYFVYSSEAPDSRFKFKLGLDLNGGTHLEYRADVSRLTPSEVGSSMDALRDVIERRVNLFGVSEPLVQVETGGVGSTIDQKLVVELPGVTDVEKAIELIGQTPLLEFRLAKEGPPPAGTTTPSVIFEETGITGRLVERAQVEFDPTTREPMVLLTFNGEGKDLFAKVTSENIGSVLGIFLDGQPISLPFIREEIKDGKATISGNFTPDEAKKLVRDLNYGALPVPIELISTQKVGASLGEDAIAGGVKAGLASFLVIAVFLTLWYRLPGLAASVALLIYGVLNLAIFKFVGVTLTAAGIAGFIISIGMSVDGNVLIFERTKEELRSGKKLKDAVTDGFNRAWTAIWDGNVTAIVSAVVLFWFGTSLIEGFALTFGLGVLVSMFSSYTLTRIFLLALVPVEDGKVSRFLFGSGVARNNKTQ